MVPKIKDLKQGMYVRAAEIGHYGDFVVSEGQIGRIEEVDLDGQLIKVEWIPGDPQSVQQVELLPISQGWDPDIQMVDPELEMVD